MNYAYSIREIDGKESGKRDRKQSRQVGCYVVVEGSVRRLVS